MREPKQTHIGHVCLRCVTPSPALRGWMWAVTVEASAILPIHLESEQKEADRLPVSAYIMWEEGGSGPLENIGLLSYLN